MAASSEGWPREAPGRRGCSDGLFSLFGNGLALDEFVAAEAASGSAGWMSVLVPVKEFLRTQFHAAHALFLPAPNCPASHLHVELCALSSTKYGFPIRTCGHFAHLFRSGMLIYEPNSWPPRVAGSFFFSPSALLPSNLLGGPHCRFCVSSPPCR